MWAFIIICSLVASQCISTDATIGGLYSSQEKCEFAAIAQINLMNRPKDKFAFYCVLLEKKD